MLAFAKFFVCVMWEEVMANQDPLLGSLDGFPVGRASVLQPGKWG